MSAHELDEGAMCSECLFFDHSRTHVSYDSSGKTQPAGICRRLPPQRHGDDASGWLLVHPDNDWCGEFIDRNPRFRVGYEEPDDTGSALS